MKMKNVSKIISFFLAATMLFIPISARAKSNSLLFSADFNDNTIPEMSKVQQLQGSATIAAENGSVTMNVPNGSANLYPGADVPAGHNYVVLELDVNQSAGSKIRAVQAYDKNGKRTTLIQIYNLGFHVNGVRYVVWSANTWHSIKVILDFENQKHYVYDNGVLLHDAAGLTFYPNESTASNGTDGFKYFQIAAEAGTNYIDNIRISSYTDKAAMDAVTEAEELLAAATVGSNPGEYPQSAVSYLEYYMNKVASLKGSSDPEYASALLELERTSDDFANRIILASGSDSQRVNDIVITAPETAMLPPSGYNLTNKILLSAQTNDQYAQMMDADISWVLESSADTVTVNSATGELEISETAGEGELIVKAYDSANPLVCAIKKINLIEGTWLLEESAEAYDDNVVIKGMVAPAAVLSGINLEVKNLMEQVLYSASASSDESGSFSFEFTLPSDLTTADYPFAVTCADLQPINSTISFVGQTERTAALSAIASSTADTLLQNVFESDAYKDIVKIDVSSDSPFGKLENKMVVLEKIAGKSFENLPALRKSFSECVAIEALSEADESKAGSVLEENNAVFGLDLSGDYLTYKNEVLKLLVKYKDSLNTVDEIKAFFDKSVIISDLNAAVKSDIEEKVKKHLEKLIACGLDENFSEKSSSKQKAACFTIFDKDYELLEDYIENMNDVLNAEDEEENKKGSSSGGGGGSLKVSNPPVKTTEPIQTPTADNSETKKQKFSDVPVSFWAYEAIMRLAEKGIVNGRSETEFVTDENVTREEFIKMILLAFDAELLQGESKFTDVCPNAWYYPYVVTAEQLGLANGRDKKSFGTGEFITRQEAATLLYRSMINFGANEEKVSESSSFKDYGEISDYAKEAVSFMYAKGIMNGIDKETFAPQGNATRAMAAKMIDSAIAVWGGDR